MNTSSQSRLQEFKNVGLYSAIAMSLSGMMGSGLFTVLGYANLTAKSHFPVAGGPLVILSLLMEMALLQDG